MGCGHWYTYASNFGSLTWFWRCKEHLCPLSPHFGFGGRWRFLTGVLHLDLDLDGLRNLAWIFLEVFISFRLVEAEKIAQRVSVYTFLAGAGCWAGLGVQNRGQAQLGSALLSFDNICQLKPSWIKKTHIITTDLKSIYTPCLVFIWYGIIIGHIPYFRFFPSTDRHRVLHSTSHDL